jgi:hypothetical protein
MSFTARRSAAAETSSPWRSFESRQTMMPPQRLQRTSRRPNQPERWTRRRHRKPARPRLRSCSTQWSATPGADRDAPARHERLCSSAASRSAVAHVAVVCHRDVAQGAHQQAKTVVDEFVADTATFRNRSHEAASTQTRQMVRQTGSTHAERRGQLRRIRRSTGQRDQNRGTRPITQRPSHALKGRRIDHRRRCRHPFDNTAMAELPALLGWSRSGRTW